MQEGIPAGISQAQPWHTAMAHPWLILSLPRCLRRDYSVGFVVSSCQSGRVRESRSRSGCPHRVLPSSILCALLGFTAADRTDPSCKMPLSGEPGKVSGVRLESERSRDGKSTTVFICCREKLKPGPSPPVRLGLGSPAEPREHGHLHQPPAAFCSWHPEGRETGTG